MNFYCLYCADEKGSSESSLEHAVPQFMGGSQAPDKYKLRNVCERCNNLLGLFVDGSYAKSWFVTNIMAAAALRFYSDLQDLPLPLICVGILHQIEGLSLPKETVAEYWIGPSGETIIWIRSHDERLYWYSGGNPIDKNKKPSTAYLSLTSADPVRWDMGIASFREAFKSKKVRRLLCQKIADAPDGTLLPGFDAPSKEDWSNISIIKDAIASGALSARTGMKLNFDHRFISKMVLAIGYSLFGEPFLSTSAAREARKGCWPKEGDVPSLRGSPSLSMNSDLLFNKIAGYPGAVAFLVMHSGSSYILTLSIDQQMPFTVELAPSSIKNESVDVEKGYVLLLFPQLARMIELTVVDLVAHSNGSKLHPELHMIDQKRQAADAFRATLRPT